LTRENQRFITHAPQVHSKGGRLADLARNGRIARHVYISEQGVHMAVLDAKERKWAVTLRFMPWRRVLRLFALATGRYRYGHWPPRPGSGSYLDAEGALVVALFGLVLAVVLLPLTLLELLAQVVGGAVLAALRASGWVRYRVDVLGYEGDYLQSKTVLLVRGGRRARRLVDTVTDERRGAEHAYRPGGLPEGVEVREHRSMWQSSGDWV
jgi:hypothetical protein